MKKLQEKVSSFFQTKKYEKITALTLALLLLVGGSVYLTMFHNKTSDKMLASSDTKDKKSSTKDSKDKDSTKSETTNSKEEKAKAEEKAIADSSTKENKDTNKSDTPSTPNKDSGGTKVDPPAPTPAPAPPAPAPAPAPTPPPPPAQLTPLTPENCPRYMIGENGFAFNTKEEAEAYRFAENTNPNSPWYDGWRDSLSAFGIENGLRQEFSAPQTPDGKIYIVNWKKI